MFRRNILPEYFCYGIGVQNVTYVTEITDIFRRNISVIPVPLLFGAQNVTSGISNVQLRCQRNYLVLENTMRMSHKKKDKSSVGNTRG
jgi:hypothetical protein